jgi:hypothetical protein
VRAASASASAAVPSGSELSAGVGVAVIEVVVGDALLRVRGPVAAEALARVLDVLEARA